MLIVLLALLLSWPALVLYGSQEISIPNNYGLDLKGLICTGSWEKSYKPYVSGFYFYMFAVLVICSMALVVLYCTVGKRIYYHTKRLTRYRQGNSQISDNTYELDQHTIENSTARARFESTRNKQASDTEEQGRLTLMLVTITMLFLINYVPLFVMIILRQKIGKHQVQFLSGASLVAFDICHNVLSDQQRCKPLGIR